MHTESTGWRVVVGHSMGSNIAQEVVFLHPTRVRALVLVGCACNTLPLSPRDAFALRPAVQDYLYTAFSRLTKDELVMILIATARGLHAEPGYRLAQPLLLAHGAHDGTGNIRSSAPTWAAREPYARYTVVPTAAHVAHMDNPSFFNRMLLDFLHEQLPSGDG